MKLTIIGSGDAFGSGGRLQSCFHVDDNGQAFLIDCGVTSLIGFYKLGLDPNLVSTIYISHLHGDHFGGLVWWILHARHVANRKTSLVIVGPKGIEERYRQAMEVFYPSSQDVSPDFPLSFKEFDETAPTELAGIRTTVTPVNHPSGAPSYALRFEVAGKIISYSGDTEWVDGLIDTAAAADVFICECFGFEDKTSYHMNWTTLVTKLPSISARRILLTHMGERMLEQISNLQEPRVLFANDGFTINF